MVSQMLYSFIVVFNEVVFNCLILGNGQLCDV